MIISKETMSRLRQNGLLDHILHVLAVGRYRAILSEMRYFFIKDRSRAKIFNGRFLCLPQQSEGIGKELLIYGVHEPIATHLYQELLEPGDRIFEAGANIGYYIAVAEETLSSRVEFLGVEPDPEVFRTLTTNVAAIGDRIRLKEIGVSSEVGESVFFQSKSSNLGSIRRSRRTDDEAKIIKTSTIDSLCEEFGFVPNVLRMDIEGAEIFALRGAVGVLAKHRPKLFIELHPTLLSKEELTEVLAILRTNGYLKFLVTDRSYDQPSALRFLSRCKPKLLTIDELEALVSGRYTTALGLIASGSNNHGLLI